MHSHAPKGIDRNQVIQLHNQGVRNSDIARTVGCHPSRVNKILREEKLFKSTRPRHIDKGKVRALWLAGWSVNEIAADVGHDPEFVKQTMVAMSQGR